jgi:hypothetical protein
MQLLSRAGSPPSQRLLFPVFFGVCFIQWCGQFAYGWVWQRQFPPNENWKCSSGCPNDVNMTGQILGMVRHALYTENREVYLAYDHSWIDSMLGPKAKVNVVGVPRDKLASHIAADYHSPDFEKDEVFQVIYSLPPSLPSGGGSYKPLSFADADVIDQFLTKNPCWIPIHDPPVAIPGEVPETTAHHAGIYDYTVILVRLPAFWFHSTCQLYTLVTKKQFPEKCPTAADISKVKAYWLGNIGWANCVHPIFEHLKDTLLAGDLLINPRAFDGRPSFTHIVNGKRPTVT